MARLNFGLLALAVGAFGIGVTEFTPMGLLPIIAHDLGVSIPKAGFLVTVYALGVMIGAPLVTLATERVPRRRLLIGLAGVFTLGNFVAAISTTYEMLLVARLITSLCHGAFFGIGSIVAASLVEPRRRASAVASMFAGLTIANVFGVPAAAWAGAHVGWHAAFWGITAVGVVMMLALRLALPPIAAGPPVSLRAGVSVLLGRNILAALVLTAVGSSAMFTVFTYIAPILRNETHASSSFVATMLVVYGLGLTAGNWLGGKAADRSVYVALLAAFGLLAVVLVAFATLMSLPAPTAVLVFIWGAASFALIPPLQFGVMDAAKEAPDLASSVNIGAFNLGNAAGAALGGGVVAADWGYPAVALAGAATAIAGFAMVVLIHLRQRPPSSGH